MRSLAPIARLGVVHGHWHARRTLMPPTRKIAFHHRQSLRGALHRVRLKTAPGRSWNVCDHYPASAVPTRSPPHHARSSPRLRSARIWMPLFVVDQVLRRHRCGQAKFAAAVTNLQNCLGVRHPRCLHFYHDHWELTSSRKICGVLRTQDT